MATPPSRQDKIETVASALYMNRYGDISGLSWDAFKARKPDIAAIYRENAEVAIMAMAKAP